MICLIIIVWIFDLLLWLITLEENVYHSSNVLNLKFGPLKALSACFFTLRFVSSPRTLF